MLSKKGKSLIEHLLIEDQKNLRLFREGKKNKKELEKINFYISKQFKKYIQQNGFPYKNRVGYNTYKAGIVLTLHLPPDDFKKIFSTLSRATDKEIAPPHKAYLIDRFRMYEKKPQLYGTQFQTNKKGELKK